MFLLAQTISIIFHPVVFSFFVFIVIIFDNSIIHPGAIKILITCFLCSNLLPIITLFLLQKKGLISDLDASIKEERITPLLLGIGYAVLGFLLLHIQEANMLIKGLMFCTITNTIVILLITRYWKISIHAMGISGLLSVLWIHGIEYALIMFIILFLVAFSRVILKAHTVAQVTIGSILGLTLTFIQIHLLFL